jgi:hypothetical protein
MALKLYNKHKQLLGLNYSTYLITTLILGILIKSQELRMVDSYMYPMNSS